MLEILLAFDPALLLAFVLAGLLLNITPGADFVFVAASGISGGPRIGMAAALGINLGVAVHIAAAALGVSALLMTFPLAYDLIRLAGAIYLLVLAWQAWQAWRAGDLDKGQAAPTVITAIRRGFLTNVLNPKTALFIFAFIPQFTDPSIGSISVQIVLLGAIFLVNGFLFVLILGVLAGHLAEALKRRVRVLNRITAVLFSGLAARLILD